MDQDMHIGHFQDNQFTDQEQWETEIAGESGEYALDHPTVPNIVMLGVLRRMFDQHQHIGVGRHLSPRYREHQSHITLPPKPRHDTP
jgi:hypothetical protein